MLECAVMFFSLALSLSQACPIGRDQPKLVFLAA